MKKYFINTKYERYLPSKKFVLVASSSLVALVAIFIIFSRLSGRESSSAVKAGDSAALAVQNQSVNDLIAQDSDQDGIADWEEALWGTDKNKKSTYTTPDATYIANKKKEMNIEASVDTTKLTETEKFAREFFSSFAAMQATGEVDQDTINGFSNALGQKIVNPTLIDEYTIADIKIDTGNDIAQKLKYYDDVKNLFQSYQSSGIGDELDIVNSGLAAGTTSTPSSYSKLIIISDAYQNFAKKIMSLTVPSDFATYHLQIANSSNNTGIAVSNMQKIVNDPLIGLEGISQYQTYSDDLVKAVGDLQTALVEG